jgi:glucose/arabinose dehydrogenase
LYFTETIHKDGTDICHVTYYCEPSSNPLGNRVYKYELDNNRFVNPKLLLDLPAAPAPTHNGGVMKIGPDTNLYIVIGDLGGYYNKSSSTRVQNFKNGTSPDGRAGILRITQDVEPVKNGILGNKFPMNLYYAYGIRIASGLTLIPLPAIYGILKMDLNWR